MGKINENASKLKMGVKNISRPAFFNNYEIDELEELLQGMGLWESVLLFSRYKDKTRLRFYN